MARPVSFDPPRPAPGPDAAPLPASPRLRVVLAALYWDYGRPERGLSYEYYNLYLCLKELYDVTLFDFHGVMLEKGKEGMNRELLALIKRERPDLAVVALFQEEFIPEIIEELKQYTTTFGYFFDDSWRIDFVRRWTPRFSYVNAVTTASLRRHREWGHENVIHSPLGYNHFLYTKRDLPKRYDVSFVGGSHEYREWVVRQLRRAGISVAVWGGGRWPAGKLSQDDMIAVFNQSRVNLNISNCASWDLRYLLSSPRAIRNTLRSRKTREQLKGRHFEICGCGGFQLSYYVEDLERCYEIGPEIAIYSEVEDLIEKIRYYLRHEDEREAIAAAGYRRALAEHTYAARFESIVNRIFGR